MTQYARPVGAQRLRANSQSLQQRVTKLESRTASIDSGFPLAVLPATIDLSYSGTGSPNAYVNGATALTGPYACASTYAPVAGDSVLMVPVGAQQQYVIIAAVAAEPFIAMTLKNSWAAASGYAAPQYRMAPPNSVEVIGAVSGASATNAIFATLPAGYIPADAQRFAAEGASGSGAPGVQCDTSGNLSLSGNPTLPVADSWWFHGFISLTA